MRYLVILALLWLAFAVVISIGLGLLLQAAERAGSRPTPRRKRP